MKRFLACFFIAALSFSGTAFAAEKAAFGDSSRGNHPDAPYASSDIIVPRPDKSAYPALARYQNSVMPVDIKGYWAEKQITYFLQHGLMTTNNGKFQPSQPITYADFAQTMARLGLKPVEFSGGSVSFKAFKDRAIWDPSHSDSIAANICGEAGIWGNPSEANNAMLGYPGVMLGDQAQRQFIAFFLVNPLDEPEGQTAPVKQFRDSDQFRSAQCRISMERLVQEKIISGYTDGTIRPTAAVTKAEFAVMLYRALEKNQFDMDKISDILYGNYHDYYWEEEGKLLDMVNAERKKNGVAPLQYDADLNALCEIKMMEKSIYGYDTFTDPIQFDGKTLAAGHVSQFYGRCTEMAETFGLRGYKVGENAAQNASSAQRAHNSLTASDAHRKNYLKPDYQVAGFAVGNKLTYEMFAFLG